MDPDDAFEELTAGMESILPPSEEEGRAFLGDEEYDRMIAFNGAQNNIALLINARMADKIGAQANLWNAGANLLRAAVPVGIAFLLYRVAR
jgi:hypothetical protein